MTHKIKVLYIAGSGRTGSTLLERLLGQFDQLGSYGELRYIWERGYVQNWPCGCGKPFHECEFWQAVLKEVFAGQPVPIDAVLKINHSVDRTRYNPQILGLWRTPHFRQQFSEYTALLQKLYAAIVQVSGKAIIVDASKFDSSGFILSQMPGIELHVLHLVRDSRAVTFSWQRHKIHRMSDGSERPQLRRLPINAALQWLKLNLAAEVMRFYAASYQRVRYEDFVRNPQSLVMGILQRIGEADADLSFISPTAVMIAKQTHSVAGNPNRLDYGEIPIRIDEEWRHKLASRDFALVTLLTLPFLLRYRYPLSRGQK
jgi:hypothetical protein